MASAGAMNNKVKVLQLLHDEAENAYTWEPLYTAWAGAELDTKSNLFSSVGIGARGVTFTMWINPKLTLFRAIRWNGEFCFLTSIVPAGDGLHSTVQAALCDPVTCRKDVDNQDSPGYLFPGVLTEKYLGHEQREPMAITTETLILVVPKEITLTVGSLVRCGAKNYEVQVPHELDEYKNEYEVSRRADV